MGKLLYMVKPLTILCEHCAIEVKEVEIIEFLFYCAYCAPIIKRAKAVLSLGID